MMWHVPCMRPAYGTLLIALGAFSSKTVLLMHGLMIMSLYLRGVGYLMEGKKETACPGRALLTVLLMVK